MKITAKQEVRVTLELNLHEVKWLMSVIQNPACEPDEEPEDSRNFRTTMWDSIKKALKSAEAV